MTTTPHIYIAGPMSGIEDYNKPAFLKGEEDMVALFQGDGAVIFNPIDSEASLMVQRGEVRDMQSAYRLCMAMDCKFICEQATHIYMLRDWENSKGAMAEWTLAKCLGLIILYE